jgi:hypothetical protein
MIAPSDTGDTEEARSISPELDLSWQRRTDSLGGAPESSVSVKEMGTDSSDSEIFDADAIDNVEIMSSEDLSDVTGT